MKNKGKAPATRNVPILGEELKVYCPVCKQWKKREEYHKDRSRPNGLKWRCKECARAARATTEPDKKIDWLTDDELKDIGYRIPPARYEKPEGPERIPAYRYDNQGNKSLYENLRKYVVKRKGDEDMLEYAYIRIAAEGKGKDLDEVFRIGKAEIERVKKAAQRNRNPEDSGRVQEILFSDLAELEAQMAQMATGQTPMRSPENHALNYLERDRLNYEIESEVLRYEAINQGGKG